MKGFYLVLFLALYFSILDLRAQRSNRLTVEGTVSVEKGSAGGAIIVIFRNGQKAQDYGIGANGRFNLELNYDNEFTLIFSHKDNFPLKIVVDTHVPQSVLQSNPRFPAFPLNITLFTQISGIDKTFSENTVQKIYYSGPVDNFISDVYYNDTQIKQLIDQAIIQSMQIGREADNLASLTRAEISEMRKEYDILIKQAENEYNREEYLNALDGYKAAGRIFPKEAYPKDRIAEINDLLGLLMVAKEMEQALKDRLQILISQGDLQFDQKNYEDAKRSYQRALSVDAENVHSRQRIDRINEILDQFQADKEYKSLITRGDNSFNELLYAQAIDFYNKARELKKDEQYPIQKISQINEILKQQTQDAEKIKGYRESIFQAELNFERQFYEKAISFYENALVHKPGDEVAIRKIDEIKSLMNMLAAKTLYDKQIKIADRAFQKKQYNEALPAYEEAASLIPSEDYPKLQLEKINVIFAEEERLAAEAEAEKARLAAEAVAAEQARLIALQAEKDGQYNLAMGDADKLFSLLEYENARAAYQKALQIKPDEIRPQQRIDEINQLISQLAEIQKSYNSMIAQADEAFGREDFNAAKAGYNDALQVKQSESYPAQKLAEIDSVLASRERLASEAEAEKLRLAAEAEAAEKARLTAAKAEEDRLYNLTVAGADSLFSLNEYENSITAYQKALQIKPDETHPQQRIDQIGQLLVQMADAKKAYDNAIELADQALNREDLETAKNGYRQAQQLNLGEGYPAKKIAEIDSIVEVRTKLAAEAEAAEQARLAAVQAERERQYNHIMVNADSLFSLNEYENAGMVYEKAMQIKPEEMRPQQRINEIGQLLGKIAATNQAYNNAVSEADDAFGREDYEAAKSGYTRALQAKQDESYPVQKLAEIDSILALRIRLAAEAEAEKARLAAEAEVAEQVRMAALQAEKDRQFNLAVSEADSLYSMNEYENALNIYQKALQLKPHENGPQQKITEIEKVLHEIEQARKLHEQVQNQYQDAIALADRQFQDKDYSASKTAYQKALGIKPEEAYPQDKIAEIDLIIKQQEQDEKYHTIILAADGFFNTELFNEAEVEYKKSMEIKPGDSYPVNQLAKIETIKKQRLERMLAEQRNAEEMERRKAEIEKRQQQLNEKQEMTEAGLNQIYNEYISLADGFFDNKNYNVSRTWYYKALGVKPREIYPTQRIEEINRLISSMQLSQRDRDFQNFVNHADSSFRQNQLAVARGWYNRALTIKPDEAYPKEQLQAISNLIAERMTGQSEQIFESHMKNASEAMESRNFNVARFWYSKALELRPDDAAAKEGLSKIQ